MKNCIRTELRKALLGKRFRLALLMGAAIVAAHAAESFAEVFELIRANEEIAGASFLGCSLFIWWIGVDGWTMGRTFLYSLWPLLAAIPYGASYLRDFQSGLYNQIVTRGGRRQYFIAKYIAVSVSGGLAVSFPLVLDLLLHAAICPAIPMEPGTFLTGIFDGNFLSLLSYQAPWLYVFLWCGIDFLWGAAAACTCLMLGTKLRNGFFTATFPLVVLTVLNGLCRTIAKAYNLNVLLSPLWLASPSAGRYNPGYILLPELAIWLLGTFVIGYRQVTKNELV